MGNILTCCVSNCGWPRGKVASSYESDIYEAVAAATSESTTVEPGKLDVGATEGQDLQHISNQKMPTGPPENRLSLKFVPPSEEDNEDGQILPSRFQGPPEDRLSLKFLPPSEEDDDAKVRPPFFFDSSSCESDNLSLVCLPRSEDDDSCSEDSLFLRCSLRRKDEEEDDDDIHVRPPFFCLLQQYCFPDSFTSQLILI
uniref:Uncharacterized protein n=1 Tax=Gorilla gorilla gorilla TaxID=9595 RepID=G3QD86_GORGO